MRLKSLLIISFFGFTTIQIVPALLGIQYLQESREAQYRALKAEQLENISSSVKRTMLLVVGHLKENAQLVASRTQMRISLKEWQQESREEHRDFIARIISDAKRNLRTVSAIHIYDRDARLVVSTDPSLKPNGSMQVNTSSDMALFPSKNRRLMIAYRLPLSIESEGIGYVQVVFNTDFIQNLVYDRTGLGQTGEWVFAVRQARGDALFVMPLKYDLEAAFSRVVSSEHLNVPTVRALTGREGVMEQAVDYAGNRVMASTRYIESLNWGLVAKINESELEAQLQLHLKNIMFLEATMIVVAIMVGLLGAFTISRPIEGLIHHLKQTHGKTFEPRRLPEKGWREVRELADSFNTMIDHLEKVDSDIDRKVEARTHGLAEVNNRLKKLAFRDPLTGLYNRRYMMDRLMSELSQMERYEARFALAMFDIDHFKSINDMWGHSAGDRVLVGIADYLEETSRKADVVGRVGGEEFLMLLPYVSIEGVQSLVDRIRQEISELSFQFGVDEAHVTVSFGVSILTREIENIDEWINQADKALYQAKHGGRNQVVFFRYEVEKAYLS